MVLEPDPFSIKREYRIEWIKQLPIAELAQMRWGQGLTYKEISRKTGIPWNTIRENLLKLSSEYGGRHRP